MLCLDRNQSHRSPMALGALFRVARLAGFRVLERRGLDKDYSSP